MLVLSFFGIEESRLITKELEVPGGNDPITTVVSWSTHCEDPGLTQSEFFLDKVMSSLSN